MGSSDTSEAKVDKIQSPDSLNYIDIIPIPDQYVQQRTKPQVFLYTITFHNKDGTMEEYEIESDRDIDLEGDLSYLEQIIKQFNRHQEENEKDFESMS